MSEENVEIVRSMLRRFNEGAYEEVLDLIDAQVEWQDPHLVPGGGTHHGHDGLTKWFVNWLDAWEDFESQPQKFIDGGDEVIVVERMHGKGRHTGIEVDRTIVSGYKVREGRVVKRIDYLDESEALKAAGLSE